MMMTFLNAQKLVVMLLPSMNIVAVLTLLLGKILKRPTAALGRVITKALQLKSTPFRRKELFKKSGFLEHMVAWAAAEKCVVYLTTRFSGF